MNAPSCTPIANTDRYDGKAVRAIRYEGPDLLVDIRGNGFGEARVIFANVVGFRVLDERELTEFWNEYSEPNGWLYLVGQGGWLELEQHRSAFLATELSKDLREYLLVDDMCISVLCEAPPTIHAGSQAHGAS